MKRVRALLDRAAEALYGDGRRRKLKRRIYDEAIIGTRGSMLVRNSGRWGVGFTIESLIASGVVPEKDYVAALGALFDLARDGVIDGFAGVFYPKGYGPHRP